MEGEIGSVLPVTVGADVEAALKKFFERNKYDGLLVASLDHSPSEQITASDDYHTTVLILSNAMQHSEYARAIEKQLNPPRLRKWKNMGQKARRAFAESAFELLHKFPVLVFAITAHKGAITKSEGHFLQELGISDAVQRTSVEGKDYLIFGPMRRVSYDGITEELEIRETANRAVMALFIAHFVRRIQFLIFKTIDAGRTNLSFYADKFPGGKYYASLVNFFLRHDNSIGDIKIYSFAESDTVETDLLADNFAGFLREAMTSPDRWKDVQVSVQGEGLFYWEQWIDTGAD